MRLDSEFKSDCKVWLNFLSEGAHTVCRPFVDLSKTLQADVLSFYKDAAKGEKLGMGGVYDTYWFFAQWEQNFIKEQNPSIEYLELLAVCTGIFIWERRYLSNQRIVVFCDNQSVVTMVNNTTSKCKNCMVLIRKLTQYCLAINTRVFT